MFWADVDALVSYLNENNLLYCSHWGEIKEFLHNSNFPHTQISFKMLLARPLLMLLEEETKDFASQMFSSGFLVIHNAAGCGQNDIAELTRGQQIVGPLLNVVDGYIEAWRDDAAFVQTSS